jgi:hypothetical protein
MASIWPRVQAGMDPSVGEGEEHPPSDFGVDLSKECSSTLGTPSIQNWMTGLIPRIDASARTRGFVAVNPRPVNLKSVVCAAEAYSAPTEDWDCGRWSSPV